VAEAFAVGGCGAGCQTVAWRKARLDEFCPLGVRNSTLRVENALSLQPSAVSLSFAVATELSAGDTLVVRLPRFKIPANIPVTAHSPGCGDARFTAARSITDQASVVLTATSLATGLSQLKAGVSCNVTLGSSHYSQCTGPWQTPCLYNGNAEQGAMLDRTIKLTTSTGGVLRTSRAVAIASSSAIDAVRILPASRPAVSRVTKTGLDVSFGVSDDMMNQTAPNMKGSSTILVIREGGGAASYHQLGSMPTLKVASKITLKMGQLKTATAYEFKTAIKNQAGQGLFSLPSPMVLTKQGCTRQNTCSGHGTCTTNGGCVCDATVYGTTYAPASEHETSLAPLGLCAGAAGSSLDVRPQAGPNNQEYTIAMRFVNQTGVLSAGSIHDFEVTYRHGRSGQWTAMTYIPFKPAPIWEGGAVIGIAFTKPVTTLSGLFEVAIRPKRLSTANSHPWIRGSYVAQDASIPLLESPPTPNRISNGGGTYLSVGAKYWNAMPGSKVRALFTTANGTVVGTVTNLNSRIDNGISSGSVVIKTPALVSTCVEAVAVVVVQVPDSFPDTALATGLLPLPAPPGGSAGLFSWAPGVTSSSHSSGASSPNAPGLPVLVMSTSYSINVAWTAPAANANPVTGYQLQFKAGRDPQWRVMVASTGSIATNHTFGRFLPGLRYRFKVAAWAGTALGPRGPVLEIHTTNGQKLDFDVSCFDRATAPRITAVVPSAGSGVGGIEVSLETVNVPLSYISLRVWFNGILLPSTAWTALGKTWAANEATIHRRRRSGTLNAKKQARYDATVARGLAGIRIYGTPYVPAPTDRQVQIKVQVDALPLMITPFNIIGYQARIIGLSPASFRTKETVQFTVRMTNFEERVGATDISGVASPRATRRRRFQSGDSSQTNPASWELSTYVLIRNGALLVKTLKGWQLTKSFKEGVTTLTFRAWIATPSAAMTIEVVPGGDPLRTAKVAKGTAMLLPTVKVTDGSLPRIKGWQLEPNTRNYGYTTGGDTMRVFAVNFPVMIDTGSLSVTSNGVEIDASSLSVALSSPSLSEFRIATPAVAADVTSITFVVTSLASGKGGSFVFEVRPALPPEVESWSPASLQTHGGGITATVLYFMDTLTQAMVTEGKLTATCTDANSNPQNITVAVPAGSFQTRTSARLELTVPAGVKAGAATIRVNYANRLAQVLFAQFTFDIVAPTLAKPVYNGQQIYKAGYWLTIWIRKYNLYFANPADSANPVFPSCLGGASTSKSGAYPGSDLETTTYSSGTVRIRYKIPVIASIAAGGQPTTIICRVTATGMSASGLATATALVSYRPPPLARVRWQTTKLASQNGGSKVVVMVWDMYSAGETSDMQLSYAGITVPLQVQPQSQTGRYQMTFITPSVAAIGSIQVYIQSTTSAGLNVTIPFSTTPGGEPKMKILPSVGWNTGGNMQILLQNKPIGVTSIIVNYGGLASETITTVVGLRKRLNLIYTRPYVPKAAAGAVTITVTVGAGNLASSCGCSSFALTEAFVIKAVPDPVFRNLQPTTRPKQGGDTVRISIRNLQSQNGAYLVVRFADIVARAKSVRVRGSIVTATVLTPDMSSVTTMGDRPQDVILQAYWSDRPDNMASTTYPIFNALAPRIKRVSQSNAFVSGGSTMTLIAENLRNPFYTPSAPSDVVVEFKFKSGGAKQTNQGTVQALERSTSGDFAVSVVIPSLLKSAGSQKMHPTGGPAFISVSLAQDPTVTTGVGFVYLPLPVGRPNVVFTNPTKDWTAGGDLLHLMINNIVQINAPVQLRVMFGAAAGAVQQVQSTTVSTSAAVRIPPGSSGEVTVLVYVADQGDGNAASFPFTYIGRDPEVVTMSPQSGLVLGGYTMRILVKNLPIVTDTARARVTIDGVQGTVWKIRKRKHRGAIFMVIIVQPVPSSTRTSQAAVNVAVGVRNPDDTWSANATTSFLYTVVTGSPVAQYAKPVNGPARGGTRVRFAFTNFFPAADASKLTVTFGGAPATIQRMTKSGTRTNLWCTTPAVANAGGAKVVLIRNNDFPASTFTWSFDFTPTVMTARYVQPRAVEAGGTVSVHAKDVTAAPSALSITLTVGGVAHAMSLTQRTVKSNGQAKFQFKMPAFSGLTTTTTLTGTLSDGSQQSSLSVKYVYVPPAAPVVQGSRPTGGSTCGGNLLTVNVKNVAAVAGQIKMQLPPVAGETSGIYSSALDTEASTATTQGTRSSLTYRVPGYPLTGKREMKLLLPDASFLTLDYIYKKPRPMKVIKLSPTRGSMAGGTQLVITVTRMMEPASINDIMLAFQDTEGVSTAVGATAFRYVNGRTLIETTTPVSTIKEGGVEVIISNTNCPSETATASYTYYDDTKPIVTKQSVAEGTASGGTSLVLHIQKLPEIRSTSDLVVKFGATYGTIDILFKWSAESTLVQVSSPEIAMDVGARSIAEACVLYAAADKTKQAAFTFTFTAEAQPVVQRYWPQSDTTYGGRTVLVLIKSFPVVRAVAEVAIQFGEETISPKQILSSNSGMTVLTFQTPKMSRAGAVGVKLTPLGDATKAVKLAFDVELPPAASIERMFPVKGPTAGGTVVNVRIKNLPLDLQAADEVVIKVGRTVVVANLPLLKATSRWTVFTFNTPPQTEAGVTILTVYTASQA